MHHRLKIVVDDFNEASRRLHALVETVPADLWKRRPEPERWSMAECVAHLNLTAHAFLPLLQAAIDEGRRRRDTATPRYRHDPIGWLLWRTMGPPVRTRVRTKAAFIPESSVPLAELLSEFDRLQTAQVGSVEAAEGLPVQKLRIRSPFASRVTYNLYSALSILPRHQHRHLWQAERVRDAFITAGADLNPSVRYDADS